MISSPFVLVSEDELWFFEGLAERIKLPVYSISGGAIAGGSVTVKSAGRSFVLHAAPRFCIGFFAKLQSSIEALAAVREVFESWSGAAYPEPALVDDDVSFAFRVATVLLPELNRAASGVAELSKGLAQLRSAHEILQNSFARAERLISNSGMMVPSRTFEAAPTAHHTEPRALLVRQLLPVASQGLAAIELHFPESACTQAGGIEAELALVETHEVVARWSLEATACKPGWVMLSLPVGLDGGALSLELTLKPLAGFLFLPELSLSAPQPLSRFQARVDGMAFPGALALRCWKTLPGVKVEIATSLAALAEGRQSDIVEVALPPRLCATVQRYCTSWHTTWEIVRGLPNKSGVFCHPPPPDLTPNLVIGAIDGFEIDRPAHVSAKCVVSNSLAAPVEFGMAILPRGTDIYGAIATGRGFSGWVRASFGATGFISAFASANPVSQQLFLVTRMADGAANTYAQASFEDLKITFLGPRELGHVRRITVAADILADFRNPLDETDDSVTYKHADHALLCHPPRSGIKLGVLDSLLPANAIGATARVRLGHPEAQPVQFCFALSRKSGAEVLACAERKTANSEVVLTDWLQVGQNELGRLDIATAALTATADDASGEINFYVLTRIAPTSANADFAWAYIEDLEVFLPANVKDS
jgi:hypothetical protein